MRSLSKILLAAMLITGVGYAYAGSHSAPIVKDESGNVVQDRHLSGFNAVDAAGSFDVYITQGPNESVKVDAPADVQDRVITEVDGGTLKIHNKNGSWSGLG